MLTDDEARDLLHRAAATIEVAPRPVPVAPSARRRISVLAVAAAAIVIATVGALTTAGHRDDAAIDPSRPATSKPSPLPTGGPTAAERDAIREKLHEVTGLATPLSECPDVVEFYKRPDVSKAYSTHFGTDYIANMLRAQADRCPTTVVLEQSYSTLLQRLASGEHQRSMDKMVIRSIKTLGTFGARPALPGSLRLTDLTEPITITGTGRQKLNLAERPEGANAVRISSTGPDDTSSPVEYNESLLTPGEDVILYAPDGVAWERTVIWARAEPTSWGRNAKGETYGVANERGTPDLVAVRTITDGQLGYAYAADLVSPEPESRADVLDQLHGTAEPRTIPVYEADGNTRISELLLYGGWPQ